MESTIDLPSQRPPGVPRTRTLIILSLIFCISYIDRIMVGALAPLIQADLKLSDTQMGLLIGLAFTLFYAIAGIPLARIADRGSRRKLIVFCLAVWSAMTMACGMAQSIWQLFLARILVGVGEAGSSPASMSILSDLYPVRQRPMAMSIYGTGAMVGVMLGIGLAGWIGAEFGWRAAFLALGAPGVILALVAYKLIHEPRRGESEGADFIATPVSGREAFRRLARNTPFVWLIFGQALAGFSLFGMSQWLPSFFVRSHGLPVATVSIFFGLVLGAGMIAGQLVGGYWGSRLARRDPVTLALPIWASLAAAPCFLVVLWAPSAQAALAITFVAALVSGLITPSATAGVQTLAGPEQRATGGALSTFLISTLGLGLGVLFVGVLSDVLKANYGADALRIALSAAQGLTLVAAFCFIMSARTSRARAAGSA